MPHIQLFEFDNSKFDSLSPLVLQSGEVQVWSAPISLYESRSKELEKLLSKEEVLRAGRFYFQKDRRSFIVARGVLRILLGRYLGIRPDLAEFGSEPNGKPILCGAYDFKSLSFNISHSHNLAVFAFSNLRNLGVDVEHVHIMNDFHEIADHYFHPKESEVLQNISPSIKNDAFFDCWTRKEAFIKATGEGMSRSLDSFQVSVDAKNESVIRSIDGDMTEAAKWSLMPFKPANGYVGAVAVKT